MGFVLVDEAGRPAEGGDLGGDGFFGIRAGGRYLNGADAVALEQFGEATELGGGEVLGVDLTAALLFQRLGPGVEGIGDRRAYALGVGDLADELTGGRGRSE